MNTTSQFEKLNEVLARLPPDRRAEIEKRAGELAMDKNFRRAAELVENSQELEDVKFVGELGWLSALSVAIAVIAV
jgi:hypothetical protein